MSCAKTIVLYSHDISSDTGHVFWCKIDNNYGESNKMPENSATAVVRDMDKKRKFHIFCLTPIYERNSFCHEFAKK